MIKSIKFFIMLLGSIVVGQTSIVNGTIAPVKEDGLYRIHVPQNIRSYTTSNFRDLRIWDSKGNQVPYFVQPARVYTNTVISDFKEFAIISNTRIADTSSTYIFKNPDDNIENAVLLFANYQGSKTFRLEGSDDLSEWFGIVNMEKIHQLNDPKETSVYKTIRFPLCNYQFLKIVFDDRNSLPVNLLKIGKGGDQSTDRVPIVMEQIPVKTITYSEEDKKTQIHINFERPQLIDQIQLTITSPERYSREAVLYILKEREVKRSKEIYRKELARFFMRSDQELAFRMPEIIESEVYLEIDNKDNPKLEISDLRFMQNPVYVTAALKTQENYKITAGDKTLGVPEYDIRDTSYKTNANLPIVEIINVEYEESSKSTERGTSFWQKTWFMWCCIGVAALVIVYFAMGLLKDLNQSNI